MIGLKPSRVTLYKEVREIVCIQVTTNTTANNNNLSAQPFITLTKLVWREYDIVAMNEWKKKWVGLQRTWVSKRTVCQFSSGYRTYRMQSWHTILALESSHAVTLISVSKCFGNLRFVNNFEKKGEQISFIDEIK